MTDNLIDEVLRHELEARPEAPPCDWGFTRRFIVVDKSTGIELGEFLGGRMSCFKKPGVAEKNAQARDAAEVCALWINAAPKLARALKRAMRDLEDRAHRDPSAALALLDITKILSEP